MKIVKKLFAVILATLVLLTAIPTLSLSAMAESVVKLIPQKSENAIAQDTVDENDGAIATSPSQKPTLHASASSDEILYTKKGGYNLYTIVDGVKTYVNMVQDGSYVNGVYTTAAPTLYTYDSANNTFLADINSEEYRFGTRNDKTYTTVGPVKSSYNPFTCNLYTDDGTKQISTEPVEETAYKFGMVQGNVSSTDVYYLDGGMNGYYMTTTTDLALAINLYVEKIDTGITRAEWLHNLVVSFDMSVEETALPDNYFSDLDESHPYYQDILLAVEFGVVNVAAGEPLYPNALVTRDFAASTLNFCLGYQLEEDAEYTFTDSAACADPDSAQVAVNRGWLQLVDGAFTPNAYITDAEITAMINDATAVLENSVVDENYDSTYDFADDVIIIEQGTEVSEDEDGTIYITDCPTTVNVGDKFAVFFGEIPVVYTAQSVTLNDNVTTISTTAVETDDAFTSVDAQGTVGMEAIEIIPTDGTEITIEKPEISTFIAGSESIGTINASKTIKIASGVEANVNVKIHNPVVEYNVTGDYAYVALTGDTTITYGVSADLISGAGYNKSITLFTCGVEGVGGFDITANFNISGSATGTVNGYLVAGLECSKADGIRAVKSFTQSEYYTNVEATASVSLKATLGVTKLPVVSAYIYAEIGARAQMSSTTYSNATPKNCTHFAAYLYARYGASASIKFLKWSKSFNKNYDIFDYHNSPVKVVHHYEDGMPVASCTHGVSHEAYFTKYFSRYSGSGWYGANGAYGLGADGIPVPLYNYTVDADGNATITKYNYNSWSVCIPKEIDGHTVVAIDDSAFAGKSVGYVEIPDTVTSIENRAFSNCTDLGAVTLPNSLNSIGYDAFYNCDSLVKINIPKSLETASFDSYYSPGVTYYTPFRDCDNIKTIEFEEGITSIISNLFWNCTGIEKVEIPDTITRIGANSFRGCLNLKEVIIPNTVTEIDNRAFSGCSALDSIKLPNAIKSIGYDAFYNCDSLAKINIPKSLANALYDSYYSPAVTYYTPFRDCDSLKTVEFEKGITSIISNLFWHCTGLEKVEIPNTVTQIGSNAFRGCLRLKEVIIPNTVTKIGNNAFYSCESLTSITIPNSVTTINQYAFYDCKSLQSIEIPNSVTFMGINTFDGCTSLESVKLPNTCQNIMEYMFRNCTSLKTIDFPKAVTTIQNNAFENCTSLESFTFSESDNNFKEIQANAFYGCTALKEVVLPESTSSVGGYAFKNCTSLTKVSIPQSTKTIGSQAFMGCEKLSDVTIEDYSITSLSESTFKDCSALEKIVLPKGLKSIGSQAFMNCTGLTEVTIPESVTSIDGAAFSYPDKTTICGKSGSYAETFANDNGFKFEDKSIPAEGLALLDGVEHIDLERGQTYRAVFEFFPEDATDVVTLTSNNSNVTINGMDIYARYTGDTVITATTSGGLSYEFTVHIRDASKITIKKQPDKLSYIMGDTLDTTGMVVQVNYNDGTVKDVTDYTVTGFDSSVEGICTVTVQWISAYGSTYKTTFTVDIVDPRPKLTGIYIDQLPDKLNYERRESLDLTGMVIKASYTDGSAVEITDYTVSGYNALKNGTQIVTITYNEYTVTFEVTVGLIVTGITVTAPDKTEYVVDEEFNTEGMVVTAIYSDGTTKVITSGYTIDGFESTTAGSKTITVTYGEFTYDFVITVSEPIIVHDVNNDGNVNNKDLAMLMQYINGYNITVNIQAADVNRDGKINNKDYALLMRQINGWKV